MSILSYFFILAAVSLRVLRHYGLIDLPPNFSSVAAVAIFSGMYLDRKHAIIIPMITMLVADSFIGFYDPAIMISVYGCFILSAVLGIYLKRNKNIFNIAGVTLSSSIIFYLVTNFAVWAYSGLYPQTLSGLMQSYILAIPFFKATLLGDIFYVSVLFGGYELVSYLVKSYQQKLKFIKNNNF